MRITSLIENHRAAGRPELEAEFGLSLHVEHRGTRILFDTGSSGAFARNARRMGIDIADVDLAVLSHHHFDHGGGLSTFLESNSHAAVHLKPPVEGDPYARVLGLVTRYVGIDKGLLERRSRRFAFVERLAEVAPGVFLLPRIERSHPRPEGNRCLYLKRPGGWERDPFEHELILVIDDADGLVVFTGCSHSGILNMLATVAHQFPGRTLKAVVGGFHFIGVPPLGFRGPSRREIARIGRELLAYPSTRYHTGHCTGRRGFDVLRGVLTDRLAGLSTGSVIEA